MSYFKRLPRWARFLLIALGALAIARGIVLVRHDPLLAFANSYDQVRYTTCLDLAPWRPGVQADRANPPAPLSRFAFQPMPVGTCTWTSDLLLTAPVALGWRISEHFGGRAIHSVRRVADLRLLVWFVVAFWATRAFLRENRPDVAIAHLAWLALVGMDPANTLYLSTFYAEAAAVFGLYVCGVGTIAALVRPTRVAIRSRSSSAALRLKVRTRTSSGAQPSATRATTASTSVVVFPVPGPASTSNGPSACSTTACCASSSDGAAGGASAGATRR